MRRTMTFDEYSGVCRHGERYGSALGTGTGNATKRCLLRGGHAPCVEAVCPVWPTVGVEEGRKA